ncbi:MAG: hypothetical protein INR66_26465, partial [Gordonia polyisoprenivorans]|nr:hypothetical protein [Gordonia polyisoprenivorans]
MQKFALVDPDLADVMRARIALAQGDPTSALRLVRGLERNELVLDAHADALVASGRAEEAARLVFDEGIARGDVPLATEGLQIAIDNGLWESARDMSLTLLGHHAGRSVRLKALRSLQLVARATNQWRDVVARTEQIMEELVETGLPVPESDHWHLVEAHYFLEKYSKALAVVAAASAISFQERNKALLFLSVLRRAMDEQRTADPHRSGDVTADLGEPRVYALFMRAAAEWAEDEKISALAMSTVLMAPGSSLSEVQIADFREYAEAYFAVHGDKASIRQISVEDDDLGPLIDFLRRDESRQEALEELTGEVRSGLYPLAVLTAAAGRTCTESLIRRDLGFVLAADGNDRLGESAARMGLGGRVVIDTTALVVAPWGGTPLRKLAAHFESVLVPAPLRQDVVDARSSLAMRSTATLGWDATSKRPVFSETPVEQAGAYADAVDQVWADVADMQVVPVPDATRRDAWLSAVTVAQEFGMPVWADDVALRRFARAVDVPAFGTLDLISVVGDEADVDAAIAAFRENRVVDLPIQEPWSMLAGRADWDASSAPALAISRPSAWADLPAAFREFQTLIRLRPDDLDPEQTVGWAYAAANGLALATVPSARPQVVAALLTWVIIHADPFFSVAARDPESVVVDDLPEEAGKVAGLVLAAAEAVGNRHFPGADALETMVDVLCRGLLEAIGPGATSRVIASLVARLDESIRD